MKLTQISITRDTIIKQLPIRLLLLTRSFDSMYVIRLTQNASAHFYAANDAVGICR